MAQEVSAVEAHRLVLGRGELGFLDVREVGLFSEGHPLLAASLPYSVLEYRVGALVPNPAVPLLLIDSGDGTALAAASALSGMGYSNVALVKGGTKAWENAGLGLFEGVHVPSKTLGELAFERWMPGTLQPLELVEWQRKGKNFHFVDCRPHSEFKKMTVPGAESIPTGEILHALSMFDTQTPIILTCAGRTRSTIAACSLSIIAPDLRLLVLENGTQGWVLSGRELERGRNANDTSPLATQVASDARERAKNLMARFGIPFASAESAARFQEDLNRTTYFFDVRSEIGAAQDPLAAFEPITAGQVVQTTDSVAGVLRSRMVLADDLGLRAAVAAFWLRALGYDAHVAIVDDGIRSLLPAESPKFSPLECIELDAENCLSEVRAGMARFLDVRPSAEYSKACAERSQWCSRYRIRELATDTRWLIVGDSGPQSELSAREFSRLGNYGFAMVRGGFDALCSAGAKIRTDEIIPLSEAVDEVVFARGRHDGDLQASRQYLEWETGLVSRLSASERAAFLI